ncbi:MAG: hypothetical protein ABIF09_13970, partial [Gemmatimonadota bacterium]
MGILRRERREKTRRRFPTLVELVLALVLSGVSAGCHDALAPIPEPGDILDRLNELPGISAREVPSALGFGREFELDIVQPLEHGNPNGGTFVQRAYLIHTHELDPMIFAPNGYATNWGTSQELGVVLHTNTLNVTHRFFLDSEPDPMDWRWLDIRQSAA